MKVTVKFFGTLTGRFPGYDPLTGMDVDVPDGARVKDLLARLDLSRSRGCFVSMNNRVVTEEQALSPNAVILILQALAGG